jgi:hypothetical protein
MDVKPDDVRRYYSTLSDKALLQIKPEDLTELAAQCYQVELDSRGLKRAAAPSKSAAIAQEKLAQPSSGLQVLMDDVPWKSNAVEAADFEHVEDAQTARDVLDEAAIPCAIVVAEQPSFRRRRKWIVLMVPDSYLEAAQRRLRTEIDEPLSEQNYTNHFEEFSDDELLDLDAQTLPEGGRKYYLAELEKRGLENISIDEDLPLPAEPSAAQDGFMIVATLLEGEAASARRCLERESVPCRVERDVSEKQFESFVILVPASSFDQASKLLAKHEDEIFGNDGRASAED